MTPTTALPTRCPRLVRERGYARTFGSRPAGADGVCRRHRYIGKKAKAELVAVVVRRARA